MKKRPAERDGDQSGGGADFGSVGLGLGESMLGVESIGMRVLALRSCGAYRVFRRLTMRGDLLSRVRVARSTALVRSSSLNHRVRHLGLPGGKGPGSGLCASQQLHVPGEG